MSVVLAWLSRQAVLLYGLCLLGVVGYMIAAGVFKRRRDIAQFSLEREVHRQRMVRAWWMAALFLLLGVVIFFIRTFVLPAPPEPPQATATVQVGLRTPTPTPFPTLMASGVTTPVVVSAPTPAVADTPAPFPTAAAASLPDCPLPGAQVTAPVAGSKLSGVVEIFGTAKINSFSFYKFEVRFPGADTPTFLAQYNLAQENALLGTWDVSDPGVYPPGGPYQFQLVVVDIYGNTTTCTIPLNIVAAQP